MKRVLALLLAAILVLGMFAGCSNKKEEPSAETNTPEVSEEPAAENAEEAEEETTEEEETSGNPLDEPGELTIMVVQQAGAPLSEDMTVMQELAKRTNTKLTFINVAEEDMAQKVQTLMVAGQLPDIVEYKAGDGGSSVQSYLDSGVFISLENYFSEELTPNLLKFFEEHPDYKKDITSDDGRVAGIAQATDRKWRCDWIVNNTFLQELGMEAPNDADSLYEYLKAVKENYPDATPMGVGPWAGGRNAVIMPILYMFNVTNEWWLYNDGQYLYGPYEKQEEYREGLRFINKLYSEGLIDPEFFSISAEDTNTKISNNQVGILYGWDDGYGQWGVNGTWGIDMIPCTPIAGPSGMAHIRGNARMATQVQYITSGCKDVERALAFYDYCFSEEGADLLNWGIEGVHYTVNESGERQYTDLIMKNENGYVIGRYAEGLAHPRLMTVIDGDAELLLNSEETALHVEYMDLPYVEVFPSIPALTATSEEEENYNLIWTEVNPVCAEYEATLITGDPDDFDSVFDEYMEKLEALNVADMCAIKHEQYDRYKVR